MKKIEGIRKYSRVRSGLFSAILLPLPMIFAPALIAGCASVTSPNQNQQKTDDLEQGNIESESDEEGNQRDEEITLLIGDHAPRPQFSEVLRGDVNFENFSKDKVTVLEFWATWCGPCLAGMPHLSDLQTTYTDRGLTIIGVSDEKPEVVKAFLSSPEWSEKITYTMALDDRSQTYESYMKAADRSGIPCAFVIDQSGRIAWIGHPSNLDDPLACILDGEWNLQDARTRYEMGETASEILRLAEKSMDADRKIGDFTKTIDFVNRGLLLEPDNLELLDMRFRLLAGPMEDPDAYELGWRLIKEYSDQAIYDRLNSIAWYVLTDPSVKNRNIDFAMTAVTTANRVAEGKFAPIYEVLARAHFESGDLEAAIKNQRTAFEMSQGRLAEHFRKGLDRYLDLKQEPTD